MSNLVPYIIAEISESLIGNIPITFLKLVVLFNSSIYMKGEF
jgi:hypothetical protein